MKKNKIAFDAVIDGQERKLAVLRPKFSIEREGNKVYNRAFRDARDSGAYMRIALPKIAIEERVWTEAEAEQEKDLAQRILDNEKLLAQGGFDIEEARTVAIIIRQDRADLHKLRSRFNKLDQITAEAQAENVRFDFFVSQCTVDNKTGARIFSSYEDYMDRSSEQYAIKAAMNLGELMFGLDPSFQKNLPENKFLVEYGFADENLRLINKDGHYVDVYGQLVDERGYLVNEHDEPIDTEGNTLTPDGALKIEFKPFVDKSGAPVLKPGVTTSEEQAPPTTTEEAPPEVEPEPTAEVEEPSPAE